MKLDKTITMEAIPSFDIPDTKAIESATDKASKLKGDMWVYISCMSKYTDPETFSDGCYVENGPTPSKKMEELLTKLSKEFTDMFKSEDLYGNYNIAAEKKAKEILDRNLKIAESKQRELFDREASETRFGNSASGHTLDMERKIQRDIEKIKKEKRAI